MVIAGTKYRRGGVAFICFGYTGRWMLGYTSFFSFACWTTQFDASPPDSVFSSTVTHPILIPCVHTHSTYHTFTLVCFRFLTYVDIVELLGSALRYSLLARCQWHCDVNVYQIIVSIPSSTRGKRRNLEVREVQSWQSSMIRSPSDLSTQV